MDKVKNRKVLKETKEDETTSKRKKDMRTIGTQTDDGDNLNKISRIKTALEGIEAILEEKWPEEIYSMTEITEMEPSHLQTGDCAVIPAK